MSATVVLEAGGVSMPISVGSIALDLNGNWIAVLELGGIVETAPTGAVQIKVVRELGEPDVFIGFIRRGGLFEGANQARFVVVGGAGELGARELGPVDHVAAVAPVTAGLVAAKVSEATGEQLAAGVETALEAYPLERWTRARGTGVEALDYLAADLDLSWRMLADGTIWIGAETWPEGDTAVQRMGEEHDDGSVDVTPDGAQLRPGTTVLGRQVRSVTYLITAGALRARLLYAVAGDPPREPAPGAYADILSAEVVEQNADGTLELKVFDERVEGLSRARLDVGLPGALVSVLAGTSVRVAFESHSPRGAFAFGVGQDTVATKAVSIVGDSVECGAILYVGPGALTLVPTGTPGSLPILGSITGPGSQRVKLR